MTAKHLRICKEAWRREVFLALVLAKRNGVMLADLSLTDAELARATIAKRFSVSEEQLGRIEREGVAACWPPLD